MKKRFFIILTMFLIAILLVGCTEHTHTFKDEYAYDESFHWHPADCGHKVVSGKEAHIYEFVEADAEKETYRCVICGFEKEVEIEHHFSEELSYDENVHFHACVDEGYEFLRKDAAAHVFSEVVVNPTFEAEGKTTYTCEVCGYSYEEPIEKLAHSYALELSADDEAHFYPCTDEGYEELRKDEAPHSYELISSDASKDVFECSVCQHQKEVARIYSDELAYNSEVHYYPCLEEGLEHYHKDEEAHDFAEATTPATFDAAGKTVYTCRVCGYSYEVVLEQLVHSFSEELSYDDDVHYYQCTDEGFENLRQGEAPHSFQAELIKASTCKEQGILRYTCACGKSYDENLPLAEHTLGEVQVVDEVDVEDACLHHVTHFATCTVCSENITTSTSEYYAHDYVAHITVEATCSAPGTKTYTCSCGAQYTEEYENPNAHAYKEIGVEGNKRTYECLYCHAQKVVIKADEVSADVDLETLSEVGSIELKNAQIDLDEDALQGLAEFDSVSIGAETHNAEDLAISEELKERIGERPVYDFSLTANGSAVSEFSGYLTITLPYVLGENEDPDKVVIWYVSGDEVEAIEATYAAGYVTFTTNHFSYYTVVTMTKAEACALFGHHEVELVTVQSTCQNAGYVTYVCSRCGETRTETLDLLNHVYEEIERVPATLDAAGYVIYQCVNCGEVKSVVLPKLDGDKEENILVKVMKGFAEIIEEDALSMVAYPSIFEGDMTPSPILMFFQDGKLYMIEDSEANYNVQIIDLATMTSTNYRFRNYDNNDSIRLDWECSISEDDITGMGAVVLQALFGKEMDLLGLVDQYVDGKIINTLIRQIVNNLLVKEEVEGKIVISFEAQKVIDAYNYLTGANVEQIIDFLYGENSGSQLFAYIEAIENKTIREIVADLTTFGIDVEGIKEFVLGMMFAGEDQAEMEEVIEQMYDASLADIIYGLTEGNVALSDYVELVLSLQNLTITEVVPMFTGKSFELPNVSEFAPMLEMLNVHLVLDENYKLEEAQIKFVNEDMEMPFFEASIVEKDLEKAEAIKAKVSEKVEPLILDEEHYAWFEEALSEKLGFDVTVRFERRYKYDYEQLYVIASFTEDEQEFFIEFECNSNNYVSKRPNSSYYHKYINAYSATIYMIVEDDVEFLGSYSLELREAYFDPDAGKYLLVSNSDNTHIYTYEIVEFDQIPADAKIKDHRDKDSESSSDAGEGSYSPYNPKNYTFFERRNIYVKATCPICGEVEYYLYDAYYYQNQLMTIANMGSSYINPAVLAFDNSVDCTLWLSPIVRNDGTIYAELSLNDMEAKYEYNEDEGFGYYEDIISNNGRFAIVFDHFEKNGCYNCVYYLIRIDNVIFKACEVSKNHHAEDPIATYNLRGCDAVNIYHCEECGEYYYYNISNHNYVGHVASYADEFSPKVTIHICQYCGSSYTSYDDYPKDFNISPSEINEEEDVLFFAYSLPDAHDYWSMRNIYDVRLTAYVEDEEGEIVFNNEFSLEPFEVYQKDDERTFYYNGREYNYYVERPTMGFRLSAVQEFEESNPEWNLCLVITNRYSSNVTMVEIA